MFEPLGDVESIRDAIEESLQVAIVTGELEAGTLVTAPDLAARFGVSPTPVREAMIELESRGFVESVRYKGFRVLGMDDAELHALVQVRQWIEGPAMAVVARKGDRSRVEGFRSAAEAIVEAARASDMKRFLSADNEFHLGLMRLSGNDVAARVVADLRGKTRLVGLAGMSGTDELLGSAEEHHLLLDLLVAGDADGADLFIRRHIAHVLGWWSGRSEPE